MGPKLPADLTLDQVRRYLDNRTKEFGDFGAEVAARNSAGIRVVAHKVKGNAALYGMPELGLAAGRLVESLESADWAEISARVDALIARLAEERFRFLGGA